MMSNLLALGNTGNVSVEVVMSLLSSSTLAKWSTMIPIVAFTDVSNLYFLSEIFQKKIYIHITSF